MWVSTYQSYLDPLIKLQKRAIRVVAGVDRLAHTGPLFDQLNLLTLHKTYVYYVQLFMFKYNHKTLPNIFWQFYTRNMDCIPRTTRQSRHLYQHSAKSLQRCRSIRCTGVRYYNYFFDKIGMDVTYATYKKKLKTHVLRNDVTKMHWYYYFSYSMIVGNFIYLGQSLMFDGLIVSYNLSIWYVGPSIGCSGGGFIWIKYSTWYHIAMKSD